MMTNDEIQKFEERKREIQQSTLESTEQSIILLVETEESGIATANELLGQGEKLKKIDTDLEEINNSLIESQKTIKGIKSTFGGLRKRLFGKKSKTDVRDPIVETKCQQADVPKSSLQDKLKQNNGQSQSNTASATQLSVCETKETDYDARVNANVLIMSKNISTLKTLATGLGEEVNKQNDLIKKIDYNVDNANIGIEEQTKQIKKLL